VTHWLIVGGGTAGCVLASRLSENIADHVTLVEAGSERTSPTSSYLDDLATPGALWDGLVVFDGRDGQARPYPQGRGLGGSSAVNGGVLSLTHHDPLRESVLIPAEQPEPSELGAIDRAMLAAASDATVTRLARRGGERLTAATSYLGVARERVNLDIVTGGLVERVILAGHRATGVALTDGTVLHADRVVCAAGAIFTPVLLLRSGVDVGGIGEGLRDHVGRVVELTLREPLAEVAHDLVTGAVLRRGAIEIVTMNHLGAQRPGYAALLVGLLVNQRRGSVRLDAERPDDPTALPVVDFGRLGDADAVRLSAGVTLAEELIDAASFTDVVSDVRVVDGFGGYAHATSTCASGIVVDEKGAVSGYHDLFVGDASVLPSLPACGTYLPVVLLAERLAMAWRSI
jgi:choline dehydrogenase-like flavoprotein